MSKIKEILKIGFLQEDFHSEVLDFLLELCSNIYPNAKLILYNDIDRYNNKELLIENYKNLVIKDLSYFIPDLTSGDIYKTFVISYDNIIHLHMLEKYKNDLIFIAHSPKHIKAYDLLGIKYFSLTPLLSKDYMLPVIYRDHHMQIKDDHINDNINNDYLSLLKKTSVNNNLKIIMTVGYFLDNNKNLKLIENLLNKGRFILVIFSPEMTIDLNMMIKKYPKYVFTAIGLQTKRIRYTINYLDIHYLLFCPPDDSNYVKNSWSGTLAFGLDHNLHIVVPEKITEIYNLKNDHILPYKTPLPLNEIDKVGEEIADCILHDKKIYNESLSLWKNNNFNRNKNIISTLLPIDIDLTIQ